MNSGTAAPHTGAISVLGRFNKWQSIAKASRNEVTHFSFNRFHRNKLGKMIEIFNKNKMKSESNEMICFLVVKFAAISVVGRELSIKLNRLSTPAN